MKKMLSIYIYIPIYTHIYNEILLSHKNEILPFVTTRMDLKGVILSDIRQKDKYHVISLINGI